MDIPDVLYKYRPLRGRDGNIHPYTRSLLTTGEIFFPSVDQLNDPHDCRPRILPSDEQNRESAKFALAEKLLSYLDSRVDWDNVGPEEMHEMALRATEQVDSLVDEGGALNEKAVERLASKFGVLSLSDEPESTLMWTHYGDAHTGICVGLDSSYTPICHARSVTYLDVVPALQIEDVALSDMVTLAKNKDYEYEREWRVVRKRSGVVRVDTNAIVELILGAKCTDEDVCEVRELCVENGLPCRIGKIHRDRSRFAVRAYEA